MLPKNKIPTYTLVLPVSKKEITFRPWLSLESKKISTALMYKVEEEIENAIVEVLNACAFNQVDFREIPFADVEFLFIKVKAKSKGEIVELTYQANKEQDGCSDIIPVELDLNNVFVSEIPERTILFSEEHIGLKMNFPSLNIMSKMKSTDNEFKKICYLIENVFDSNQVYDKTMFSEEELLEWVNALTEKQMEQVLEFLQKLPTIKTTLTFFVGKNKKTIELSGVQDFFL